MLHAIRALLNTRHQAHPSPYPLPSKTLSLFPGVYSLSWFSPPLIPTPFIFLFSECPPCYSLCSTSKWNHIIIDFPCLTYFSQHNSLLSHPCWCKSWLFIISDGWVIFCCVYGPPFPCPFVYWRASLFSYCGHCCNEHWGIDGPSFHYICIFGAIK